MGALSDAMSKGQGRSEIGKTLDFLGDYVVRHFAAEEKRMDELGCSVAAANKQTHKEFLATFKALRQRFDDEGASSTLVLEISSTVQNWLVDHIRNIDTQLNTCVAGA